jgi:hypothetical protein
LLVTFTFIVKPVTPELSRKTLSMPPLLLVAGMPEVATEVSEPPVTVPTVSCNWVFTALLVLVGSTVCRVVAPV